MSERSEETKTKVGSAGELSDVDNENCSSSGSGGGGGDGGSSGGETKKACVDCGTLKTPLWRGGPAGPKSLCNACGIKSRKKRQAALGIKPEKKDRTSNSSDSDLSHVHHRKDNNKIKIKKDDDDCKSATSASSSCSRRVSKFLDLGLEVPVMKRSAIEKKKKLWKKLDEEEQAAVLLMALSCGIVYA